MTDLMEYEAEQVATANASGKTPIVFVHGLWLLPSSWDRWRRRASRPPATRPSPPGWPDDPNTVDEAQPPPRGVRPQDGRQIADHFDDVIRKLKQQPAVVGHSFGGLLTADPRRPRLSRRRRSPSTPRRSAACCPLPISALKSASPVLGQPCQPRPRGPAHLRAVPLRVRQRGERERSPRAVQHLRGAGRGRPAVPGRDRQPQPVDRGEGQDQEPRPRPAAHRRRRARTTPSRGRSRTRRSRSSGATRASPRSSRSRTAATRSTSTTVGERSPTPR